jgi:hypothetical protein
MEEKHKKLSPGCGNENCCEVMCLAIQLWLAHFEIPLFWSRRSAQRPTGIGSVTLRSVHIGRSVGRSDFVAVLACLLPAQLTVVRQAACFWRTVVDAPFMVVTQSHFTLFKNSSSK